MARDEAPIPQDYMNANTYSSVNGSSIDVPHKMEKKMVSAFENHGFDQPEIAHPPRIHIRQEEPQMIDGNMGQPGHPIPIMPMNPPGEHDQANFHTIQ